MRSKYLLLFVSLLIGSCSSSKPVAPEDTIVYSRGMSLVLDGSELPVPESRFGMARVMKGNSFSNTGAFISEDGLLVTNYTAAIDLVSSELGINISMFKNGFLAGNRDKEIPLTGVALLVFADQTDVTDIIQRDIVESELTNYQITQAIEKKKTELIEQRTGNNNDLIVEINDIYSGNRQIMNAYQVVRDVRLVFSPPVILSEDTHNSRMVYKDIADEFVLFRAYLGEDGAAAATDVNNIPFKPQYVFSFADQLPQKKDSLTALGVPAQTYRMESVRAIDLYHNHTNPYTLGMLEILLDREEQRVSDNPEYDLPSLAGRVNLAQNVLLFENITDAINENDLINTKQNDDEEYISWIKEDTSRILKYNNIFFYLNEAFDLALQTADIFYASSYFCSFSALDDLAQPIRQLTANDVPAADLNTIVQRQKKLISGINIEEELKILIQALKLMQTMPEDQKPLLLYDIFESDSSTSIPDDMLAELRNSVLFKPDQLTALINEGDPHSDLLYTILEEIIFSQEMAQQNISRYVQYEKPAQQIYARLQMEADSLNSLKPDGNNTFRSNKGSLMNADSVEIKTSNDFSGRAQGSVILDSEGNITGLVGDKIDHSIFGNYYYTKYSSYVHAVRPSSLLDKIRSLPGSESLINEISGATVSR